MADNLASFLWAIKQQESGGDYSVVNSGSGALGAYQVMPDNVSSWTQQALGYSLTPQQYLNNPAAQDAVAQAILGGYYQKYGAAGAAAMWYSGQPDPTKGYGDPPVSSYVNSVLSRMSTSSPVSQASSGSYFPIPGLGLIPNPGDLGSQLSDGLQQGLTSAFKAILGPVLAYATWALEVALGGLMLGFGLILVVKNTEPVQAINRAVTDIVPETRAVKTVAAKKPKAVSAKKPEEENE